MGNNPIPAVPVRKARPVEIMRLEAARDLYVRGAETLDWFEETVEQILSGNIDHPRDARLFKTAFPRPTMQEIAR